MARATLTRIYMSVELADGTVLEDLRVTLADQARYQRSARVGRWDKEDAVKQQSYFAWSSAERQGLTELSWEEWERAIVDLDNATLTAAEDRDRTAEDGEEDPTQASTS